MSLYLVTQEGRRIAGESAMDLLRELNARSLSPEPDAWRYMVAISERMRRLRGRGLDTSSPASFLRELHRAGYLQELRLDETEEAPERSTWLRELAGLIRAHYVRPNMAERLAGLLEVEAEMEAERETGERARANPQGVVEASRELWTLTALAAELEDLLRSHSRDAHFALRTLDPARAALDAATRREARERRLESEGHGLRVQAPEDGIGGLRIDYFGPLESCREAVVEAFAQLESAQALVIDLRGCRGGAPETIAWISSFLFDAGARVHLNDIHHRDGRVESFHTVPDLEESTLGGSLPLCLLVGPDTFSGGEEFAWNLQALGRARVVGEFSRGAAHPSAWHTVGRLRLRLPFARSVNPHTGTNWEGTGVRPDVVCRAERAERMARRLHVAGLVRG